MKWSPMFTAQQGENEQGLKPEEKSRQEKEISYQIYKVSVPELS